MIKGFDYEDLAARGDFAARHLKQVLDSLDLLIAVKDNEIIFADRKLYMEENKKASVSITCGELNKIVYSSLEDVPDSIKEKYKTELEDYDIDKKEFIYKLERKDD